MFRLTLAITCVSTVILYLGYQTRELFIRSHASKAYPVLLAPALRGNYCRNLVGIVNGGSTCYQNSLLQCLLHSPIFPQAADGDTPIAVAMRKLYTDMLVGLVPGSAAELRGAQGPPWDRTEQQDAQEYLAALRDQQLPISAATEIKCDEVLKCTACNEVTRKNDTLLEIQVALTGATNLADLLRDLSTPEDVTRTCEACGGLSAEKTTDLKALPPMVVIQLKRFSFEMATLTPSKISTMIECPLTDLAIPLGEGSALYDLHATVEHYGGAPSGGHYVAHVFDRLSDTWFTFNDASAQPLDASRVVSGDTYLLFYVAKPS